MRKHPKGFVYVTCSCGCGAVYPKDDSPIGKFEVVQYCTFTTDKVLEVKRLSDGETFRLGNTVTRESATGKKRRPMVIDNIVVLGERLILQGPILYDEASGDISNDSQNAKLPDFRYIKKIIK